MNGFKEKLINLLKKDKQVKQEMEKLKFGCIIDIKEDKLVQNGLNIIVGTTINGFIYEHLNKPGIGYNSNDISGCAYSIIGTLEERHLRIYMLNRLSYGYSYSFNIDEDFSISHTYTECACCDDSEIDGYCDMGSSYNCFETFDNQTDEFYMKLYDYLSSEF